MTGKRPWTSKTFWFNVLALAVAIAKLWGFADFQLTPEMAQVAVGIVAAVNLILRFVTKQPLSLG